MAALNKVVLIGHLTADPELKQTPKGISVTSFSIGINRKFEKDKTDFIDIVAWRQTAEFICKYFRKGTAICVCGSIQTREYDKGGQTIHVTEVVADDASFVEKAEKGEYSPPRSNASSNTYQKRSPAQAAADDSDAPF